MKIGIGFGACEVSNVNFFVKFCYYEQEKWNLLTAFLTTFDVFSLLLFLCGVFYSCSSSFRGCVSICPLLNLFLALWTASCPATESHSIRPGSGKMSSLVSGSLCTADGTRRRAEPQTRNLRWALVFCQVFRVQWAAVWCGEVCGWNVCAPEQHMCTHLHQRREGSELRVLCLCEQHDHPVWPERDKNYVIFH